MTLVLNSKRCRRHGSWTQPNLQGAPFTVCVCVYVCVYI